MENVLQNKINYCVEQTIFKKCKVPFDFYVKFQRDEKLNSCDNLWFVIIKSIKYTIPLSGFTYEAFKATDKIWTLRIFYVVCVKLTHKNMC